MEEPIVDPNYEFEAPQFVNFNNVLGDEDDNVDSWFDGKPDDEGGIQIPIDVDEEELQKDGDSKRPKRLNVVDVDIAKLQEAPLISIGEAKPTPIIAPSKTDNIEKNVVANPNDKRLIQPDSINVENNQNITELKSETKYITESDQRVVCEQASTPQNDTELLDVDKGQVEKDKNAKENCQESVQQTDSDKHVISADESPTECIEKAESDTEYQKEGISTGSENGNSTTQEETKNEQPKTQEQGITRASKRNRSLNSGANGVPNKRKKSGSGQSRQTRSMCSNPQSKIKVHHNTIPITPQCMKRQKTNKPSMIKLKTTEQLEMECIVKLRKQTKHHIKMNENLMKKAISCPAMNSVRAPGASLTRPQEFHFQTDTRVKQHPMKTRADQPAVDLHGEDMEMEFWKGLRQHPPSPSWKHRTATVPKPFNLSDGGQKKRKHSAMDTDGLETDSYHTMAYQVYKFQTTTPPRFRTRKANEAAFKGDVGHQKAAAKTVTLPKTPNLSTKTRSRPVAEDVLSKDEREEREVEEMKNYKFKAKPLDRRIIDSDGMYGVRKPEETIPATKPKPFLFESDERLVARKEKEPQNQEEAVNFKAVPQPSFEKVFRPQLKHARTEPKPFSFEDKDKERWQKKDEKIQDVYREEERLREFKAQPLPSDSPDPLPAVSSKSGTSFKPFALNTENRGAKKAERWIQKVRSELEECRTKATFKAQPCKVVHDAPFVPQKSTKPLTEVSQFVLNTNHRSERREELETTKKEREQIDEELRKQRDTEREREEEEALVLLRKNLVHKAQPIHKYKKVKVKPSSKPLTDAQSPAWSEMKRRRVESQR